jgi:hypothetical protein
MTDCQCTVRLIVPITRNVELLGAHEQHDNKLGGHHFFLSRSFHWHMDPPMMPQRSASNLGRDSNTEREHAGTLCG